MPKRISKPRDVSQAAFEMVRRSTEEVEAKGPKVIFEYVKPNKNTISSVMAEMGRRGGRIGGKRRLETMTPAQRSKIAKKAAKTRWQKSRKGDV